MIPEELLANLPDDPELAFVHLEKKFREEMNANLERADNSQSNSLTAAAYTQYINHTIAIAKELGLEILQEWQTDFSENTYYRQQQFVADVDHYLIRIQIRHTRRTKGYSVAFDHPTKAKIRHHLSQIKDTVDRLEIPQTKKEALYAKIGALESEVDRDRTRFDVYSALLLEAATTTGKAARKLKPLMKLLQPITVLFANAKEDENTQLRLPPPETLKRLEPPQLKLAAPEPEPEPRTPINDLDDDIPF
jgi:hypothetical protein